MNELKISRYAIGDTSWEIYKDRIEDYWYLENLKSRKMSMVDGQLIDLPSYIENRYLHLYRFKTPEDAFKVWETKLKDNNQ
jgi:hypothetical protein